MALISASVRRAAAVNLLAEGSRYGRFRFLSDQLSVSPRWLHKIDRRLRQSVFGGLGEAPSRSPSMPREPDLRASDGLDRCEVSRRLVACLGAQGSSVRDISEVLREAIQVDRGHSAIAEDIRSLGRKAQQLLDGLHMEEKVTLLAPDEVYAGDDPILMTVEPCSLAWLSADLVRGFDGLDWATRFSCFPLLEEVVADAGASIRCGARLCGLSYRYDHFHALRALRKGLLLMEFKAYRWMKWEYEYDKREEKLRRKMKDQRTTRMQAALNRKKALEAATRYDLACWLAGEIRVILRGRDKDGHPLAPESAAGDLEVALELLAELRIPKLKTISSYLEPTKVLAFLSTECPSGEVPIRASSCVETINSLVRMDQQGKKRVSQEYLHLARWRYNLRPFSTGKRRGKRPAQLLGIENLPESWVTSLLT